MVPGHRLIMLEIGSLSIPMSSTATSSATSRAGSTNKRVSVNFSGKTSDYEEYEPGGGYFRSRSASQLY